MTGVLIQTGNLVAETYNKGRQCEYIGEESYVQENERGLEQILPYQPKERINPAETLILDF